jgi:large conductance mechanosensitive channel
MPILSDFKKFALRGNVVDLAIGVIIGAAFSKIVTSLVEDILMPPLGLITGRIDFTKLAWHLSQGSLKPDGTKAEPVLLRYGNFLQICFQFLIVAFVIFLIQKLIISLEKEVEGDVVAPAGPPELSTQEKLLVEIRDALKQGSRNE